MLRHLILAVVLLATLADAQDKDTRGLRTGPEVAAPDRPPHELGQEEARPFALMVGDAAPAIQIAEWVQGPPVTAFQPGQVYVVDFWATWCRPSEPAIAHLNELSKKYAGQVRFVGVSVFERIRIGAFSGKVEGYRVPEFVKRMGDQMTYAVGADQVDKEEVGPMGKNWMNASGQDAIPSAFIVNREGRIAWVGHPLVIDDPLAKVVAGTWDLAAAAKKHAADARFKAITWKLAKEISEAKKEPGVVYTTPKNGARVIRHIDEAVAANPAIEATFGVDRYLLMLDEARASDASVYGQRLVSSVLADTPSALNQLAEEILHPKRQNGDFALAVAAAERAVKLVNEKDASFLDTLGLALFKQGQIERAIQVQEKAVTLAAGQDVSASYGIEKRLALFLNQKATNTLVAREYAEAIELLNRALEIQPEYEGTAYELARANSLKGDLDKAIEWIEKAGKWCLEQHPPELVECRLLDMLWQDAFLENVRKDPRFDATMAKLAKEDIDRFIDRYSHLLDEARVSEAALYGQRLVSSVLADNASALNQLAQVIHDADGDLVLAVTAAERAVKLVNEKDPSILNTLGLVLFKQGQIERAIQVQEKAVTLAAGHDLQDRTKERLAWFLSQKAIDALAAKKYAEGIELLNRVLEIQPKDEGTAYNLACAHSLKSDLDKAIEWLEKAVEWGWGEGDGQLLGREGRAELAMLRQDADLENVRNDPRFDATMAKVAAKVREARK